MNGIELKENRIKHGLTQEKLAELIGVSKRTVINYEHGEVIPATKSEILHRVFEMNEGVKPTNEEVKDDEFTALIIDKLFKSDIFKEKLLDYIKDNAPIINPEVVGYVDMLDFVKKEKKKQI